MTKQQIHVMQNGQIKGVDFDVFGGIDNFLRLTSDGGNGTHAMKLRTLVPWLQKAVTMTANAVSQLPYYIEDGSENIIEEDTAWGGVRNPQTLINKIAASLCGGSAYLLVDSVSGGVVDLQYLVPSSIKPNFNSSTGELVNFTRTLNGATQNYSVEQIIYFWLPDDTIETGPAQITPIANALLPAGILAAQDDSLRSLGERGFMPFTLLGIKGMTSKSEAERTERWWNRWLRNPKGEIAKILNIESVSVQSLGAGMDELRGSYTEISTMQIKNISAAFGIPVSTFLSDENSYATALSDTKLWYTSSQFVSIYQTVEDTLSDQLWSRWGWNMEYQPEQIEAFQTEETDKTGALQTLTTTIKDNPTVVLIAAEILGYDLTEEQKTAIEALKAEPEPEPIPAPLDMQNDTPMELPTDEENAIADEMRAWRKYCERPHKREFDTKAIPSALKMKINAGLREAKSQDEITAVFDLAVAELPIVMLANAINRLDR